MSPLGATCIYSEEAPGRALDLGAATGTNMVTLKEKGLVVEGVEYALVAVRIARKKSCLWGGMRPMDIDVLWPN